MIFRVRVGGGGRVMSAWLAANWPAMDIFLASIALGLVGEGSECGGRAAWLPLSDDGLPRA